MLMLRRISLMGVAVALCLVSQWAWAQPGGAFGQGGRGMNMFGGNLFLLADEKVQKDLDLSEDQIEHLKKLQDDIRNTMMNMFQGMQPERGGDPRQMFQEMQEKAEATLKEFEEDLNDILLPHQTRRLKQIAVQSQNRGRGVGGSLLSENVRNELNITREQEQKLKEAAEQLEKELQEKIAKLRRDSMNKLLDQLTPEQREKYRELVGDPIEFGNPFQNMMRMGQQGGERQRRGGGRSDF
ncbi:MAG TPA: hypothetical protein PKD54_13890 [Pirellulaceae bacterium]|nr:hypothetical protein [Pirellulaceae bacterium]